MKKIKVIQKVENTVEVTLTQAERELKYEALARDYPEINKEYFSVFSFFEEQELQRPPKNTPGFPALILKELLRIGDPIVSEDEGLNNTKNIEVQINTSVELYNENGEFLRTAAKGTNLHVIGLRIRGSIKNPDIPYELSSYANAAGYHTKPLLAFLRIGCWHTIGRGYMLDLDDTQDDLSELSPAQSPELSPAQSPKQLLLTNDNSQDNPKNKKGAKKLGGDQKNNPKVPATTKRAKKEPLVSLVPTDSNESSAQIVLFNNNFNELYKRLLGTYQLYDTSFLTVYNRAMRLIIKESIPIYVFQKHDITGITDDIKLIESAIDEKLDNQTNDRFICTLHSLEISHLYYLLNMDRKRAMQLIDVYRKRKELRAEMRKVRIQENLIRVRLYQKNAVALNKYGKDFTSLTKQQKEEINTIVEHRENLFKNTNIPAELLEQVYSLNRAVRQKAFKEITKITSDIKIEDIICKHYLYFLQEEQHRDEEEIIVDIIKEYSGTNTIHAYTCKLCGEILAPMEYEKGFDLEGSSGNEGLLPSEKLLYSIASQIISRYVSFRYITAVRLTRDMFRALQPFIVDLDTKLHKVKSNSEEIINNNLQFYIAVYSFAYLIHVIITNEYIEFTNQPTRPQNKPGKPEISEKKSSVTGDKKTKKGACEVTPAPIELITGSGDIICTVHGCECTGGSKTKSSKLLFTFIPGKSVDEVSNKVRGGGDDRAKMKLDLFTIAINIINREYNYIYGSIGMTLDYAKQALVKAYNDIGDQTIDTMDTNSNTSITHDPFYRLIAEIKKKNPSKIEDVLGWTLEELEKLNPGETIYDKVTEIKESSRFPAELFNAFLQYNKLTMVNTILPPGDELSIYKERLNEIKAEDRQKRHSIRVVKLPCSYSTKTPSSRKFKLQEGDLSLLFDTNGNSNKWDIVVTNKGEKTKKEIAAMIGEKDYTNLKVTDYKNSKLGIYKSKLKSIDVLRGIEKKNMIESFYNYYTFKCPVSTIHEWDSGSCQKCGIETKSINDLNEKYYSKWESKFKKDRLESKFSGMLKLDKVKLPDMVSNVKLKTDSISKIASMFNIEYNVLINLGFSEGVIFNDIKQKLTNPYESNEIYIHRCLHLIDYYNYAKKVISQVRNYKMRKLEPELNEIINTVKVNDVTKIPLFKDIEYNHYTSDPKNESNILLGQVFDEFIRILDNKETKEIVRELVRFILTKFISFDNLFSKVDMAKIRDANDDADLPDLLDSAEEIAEQSDEGELGDNDFSFDGMDFDDIGNVEPN